MPDRYSSFPAAPFGPAGAFFAVTPNDGAELAYLTTGLYIGALFGPEKPASPHRSEDLMPAI